jgi:4-hydroxy-tetrahydrodipicolinate reductase
MTNIVIQGINGRMGHVLQELIEKRTDCKIVGGVDLNAADGSAFPVVSDFGALAADADVLIDFSAPAATRRALDYCEKKHLPCVICTTGLDDALLARIEEVSRSIPVFRSANMSMGINLLAELCRRASRILGESYDVEIVEKHHHNKVDAPSGTALLLADEINAENGGKYHYVYDRQAVRAARDPLEIGISSVRGGSIVGEHEVLFCGPDEVITLQHTAYSRTVFANGAIHAALYLAKKGPGLYNMGDMIAEP